VESLHLYNVLTLLKVSYFIQLDVLIELSVIDELNVNNKGLPRFRLIYTLLSTKSNLRINVHTYVNTTLPEIKSVQSLFYNASWLEREA
jgi:NADH:ubiquinone oxidoreductase subunit C